MDNKFQHAHIRAAHGPLRGRLRLSGDKSVSIRRALFALFLHQDVRLTNFGTGEDCQTSLLCLEMLGRNAERRERGVTIHGGTLRSGVALDCRNSGTTARLLMGLLAGQNGEWTLVGDASLSRRPMLRVADPLRRMGAQIELSERGTLPAQIYGAQLRGCDHDLKVSSAQVKSALLLAGLQASEMTRVREPIASRDHTERLLELRQAPDGYWSVDRQTLAKAPLNLNGGIPGDISSAAFWAVAALLVPDSVIEIESVLLNPLRAAWFNALRNAGADIQAQVEAQACGEPVGTMIVRHSKLSPLHVCAADVPGLIDEIPALAVLAATIDGTSRFEQVGELRVKESDRLQAIADGLQVLGAQADIHGDDLIVHGGKALSGAVIDSHDDHRIAMSFALAGLAARGETLIREAHCAAVSYPEFFAELSTLSNDSVTLQ